TTSALSVSILSPYRTLVRSPPLKKMSVGIDALPSEPATSSTSPTSAATILTLPLYSFSSCSTTGVSRTQLGHHSAQKSTTAAGRSEEHTSELQSRVDLVCRL